MCFLLTRNQQHSRFRRELYSVVTILLVSLQWPRTVVTVGVGRSSGDVFFPPFAQFLSVWAQVDKIQPETTVTVESLDSIRPVFHSMFDSIRPVFHSMFTVLTHWGRGHLNCLNARSRGLNNLNQLLYRVSLNIYNKFANNFCELKFSGNTHRRP